jgi:hypothetical protein
VNYGSRAGWRHPAAERAELSGPQLVASRKGECERVVEVEENDPRLRGCGSRGGQDRCVFDSRLGSVARSSRVVVAAVERRKKIVRPDVDRGQGRLRIRVEKVDRRGELRVAGRIGRVRGRPPAVQGQPPLISVPVVSPGQPRFVSSGCGLIPATRSA